MTTGSNLAHLDDIFACHPLPPVLLVVFIFLDAMAVLELAGPAVQAMTCAVAKYCCCAQIRKAEMVSSIIFRNCECC